MTKRHDDFTAKVGPLSVVWHGGPIPFPAYSVTFGGNNELSFDDAIHVSYLMVRRMALPRCFDEPLTWQIVAWMQSTSAQ